MSQVVSENVVVYDSKGREVESQLVPPADAYNSLRSYYVKAYLGSYRNVTPKYWLAFMASVPPLGFNTYRISDSKRPGFITGLLVSIKGNVANELTNINWFLLLITGAGSTKSTIHTFKSSEISSFEVGQGNLKLIFSAPEGNSIGYTNSKNHV